MDQTGIQRRPSRAAGEELYPSIASPSNESLLRKGCSIVMQDNNLRLSSQSEKTNDALGRSYRDLQMNIHKNSNRILPSHMESEIESEEGSMLETSRSVSKESYKKTGHSPPLPQRSFSASIDSTLRKRGQIHLQSADLFDNFSPVQKQRRFWQPILPDTFMEGSLTLVEVDALELKQRDAEALKTLHPTTFGRKCIEFRSRQDGIDESDLARRPLRVGLILSGGPAPGGHNVIAGVYDYIKEAHPESQLYGFMGGLDGLFQKKYRLVNNDLMDRFRNQGGFDMLWSGRGRINGKDDLEIALRVSNELELQGLIIVGGDGSNSNAALLSEYFGENSSACSVIGVPKTIDGDLRNPWIETSFGFDTAAKTYSELIGNLCTDITTAQQVYHFVRVMGRSASHLVIECALQTRPNLVFVGEEVEEKKITLQQIVNEIADLIVERFEQHKLYGIVLFPEGLIEFIPEMKQLINELNTILISPETQKTNDVSSIGKLLSPASQSVWEFLPESMHEQLLMDREASGYIQVAKIATERLLQVLTEAELNKRDIPSQDIITMTHYFGYEGRCAMPSNFDANYCYALGFTAGALIEHKKNGYVSVVRYLDQHASMWQPGGVPFTRIMEVKTGSNGVPFPAVTRQLVDLKGGLFKVLCEVRGVWKLKDCYRCPGPIQFEGPVSDIADYTVALPTKEDLLWGMNDQIVGLGRAVCPKRVGTLSELQKHRLQYKPDIPDICRDIHARATSGPQYLPKDLYTQRQILLYYPYMCNSNHFYLKEILTDKDTPPVGPGLRIGVVFVSRQSPGVMNVLWGVHERLKCVGGRCIGFYGTDGLFNGKFLEITDKDLELYVNQGGMELLGRPQVHTLLIQENQERARQTCERFLLDGLIVVGSSLAITEASLTAEYFLAKGCRTSVIGIPATGSNNLTHDLIETNIGFDTSSKLYANLIGNVLTEAASMPKYWHFVRLMGRQPSNEVLECALQTHPNILIIAEEYGAANKTLWDVVNDIADVVCRRSEMGKDFGSVLIPDGLLSHLPNMRTLMNELGSVIRIADKAGHLKQFQSQLENMESYIENKEEYNWRSQITPWSLALFKSLPKYIRKELCQVDMGEMRYTLIETELLLSQMVKQELERRRKENRFNGKFAAVCHFFGYQGRSSMPSQFDARLAFAYGHLASICVESGLTAHCCTIRGLVGDTKDWKLGAIPFNSMFAFMGTQDDVHPDLKGRQTDMPIIPSAEVNLNGKAYRWMRIAIHQWQLQDRFCNPGPVQFDGKASNFYHRMLHEEQAEYFNMLKQVQLYSNILKDTCNFGVEENFLKVAFANLNALLALRYHPDDLMTFLQPLADLQRYENLQRNQGKRPKVWQHTDSGAEILLDAGATAATSERSSIDIPFRHKPSVIGLLATLRLQSLSKISHKNFEKTETSEEGDHLLEIPTTRLDSLLPRPSVPPNGEWGDQQGVEAYPRSTL